MRKYRSVTVTDDGTPRKRGTALISQCTAVARTLRTRYGKMSAETKKRALAGNSTFRPGKGHFAKVEVYPLWWATKNSNSPRALQVSSRFAMSVVNPPS